MKLVIVIPAYNEEENIEKAVMSIPRKINGVDKVEVLVINDGSADKTADMALNGGANKVVSHTRNIGVGAAFMTGIRNAILMNADIVVTIDADSQFDSKQIPELIVPILNKQLDVVIGSRFDSSVPKNIPRIKLIGNKIFSKLVSWVIGQKLSDTQTGFRAYSKKSLMNISVVNNFTYTQEVLIDLKFKGIQIGEIPVTVTEIIENSIPIILEGQEVSFAVQVVPEFSTMVVVVLSSAFVLLLIFSRFRTISSFKIQIKN